MSIQDSPLYKIADKLAEIDPNKTLRSVVPITTQVGKIEVASTLLLTRIERLDPDISKLVASVEDATLSNPSNQTRLSFVQKSLNSYRDTLNTFKKRLEVLERTPNNLTNASLTLSGAGTAIKILPIPLISLTAGATSTFSGKLADVRAKGRDLLDAAETSNSLLEDTELAKVDQELTTREQKVKLLLEIQRLYDKLSSQQLTELSECLGTTGKPVSQTCLQNIKDIFDPIDPLNTVPGLEPKEDLYVVDYNGVSYRVIIQVVDAPFSNDGKTYRRALAVRQDGMIKCVTEIAATEDVEYFIDSLRRCLFVKPFLNIRSGRTEDRRPVFFIPSSLLFVGSFQNQTDLLILHSLNTNDFIIQVYQDEEGSLQQIVPESIKTVDNSRIEIKFSQPTSGKVIFNKPTAFDTIVDTAIAETSKTITHNLSVELPLIQVYSDNEILIPEVIEILDDNTIRVQLSEPTDFRVVTFNPPARNTSALNNNSTFVNHRFNTTPPLVQVYYNNPELVRIIPERIQVINSNIVEIKINSLLEHRAITAGASEIVEVDVLSCALTIEVIEVS